MRKHPLIALVAFIALTASAIAGASTGSFQSSSVLTGARMHHASDARATRLPATLAGTPLDFRVVLTGRDLRVVHDPSRPPGLRLSLVSGLPISARAHVRFLVRKVAPASQPATYESASTDAAASAPPPPPPVTTTTTTAAPVTTAVAGGVWYELRMCESGDNYAENTGNGYYGAYQFALSTWESLGFTGLPSDASPATQDQAAEELQAEYGWSPWPACSAELGL